MSHDAETLARKRYCEVLRNKYGHQCGGRACYLVFYNREDASTGLYACGQHLAKAVKTLRSATSRLTYSVYVISEVSR